LILGNYAEPRSCSIQSCLEGIGTRDCHHECPGQEELKDNDLYWEATYKFI